MVVLLIDVDEIECAVCATIDGDSATLNQSRQAAGLGAVSHWYSTPERLLALALGRSSRFFSVYLYLILFIDRSN